MLFSEMSAKDALKLTKQRMVKYQDELLEQLNAIEVDAHWFRRVFHTFAASFLFYYILPDGEILSLIKIVVPIGILLCMTVIEYHRVRGSLNHQRFFGLRSYEKKRPASYLYFGIAVLLLFLLFPQQIAIPCILCASFTDPIIGESRYYLGKKRAYLIGFFVSLFFFLVTWYQADYWILILVSFIGATGALIGEAIKLKLLDDDFMIQMLPAIILYLVWQGFQTMDIHILPPKILLPMGG
jgi:dolichol kinase